MSSSGTADRLRGLLAPQHVAIVGASSDPGSPGGRPIEFLRRLGWEGTVHPVNPTHSVVAGLPCVPSVLDLPEPPDLAAVAVPAVAVPSVLAECKAAGVPMAIVFSAGFDEGGEGGVGLQEQIAELTRDGQLRVLGPNCEGLMAVPSHLALTFSPVLEPTSAAPEPMAGPIGVISQSGGLGFALLDQGAHRHLGFSHVLTCGNEVDIDALELCDVLIDDSGTRVIALLIEGLRDGRRLVEVAQRAAAAGTQLVVSKLGVTGSGRRSTLHHTGHDAGNAHTYRRLFDEAGVHQTEGPEELLDVAAGLALAPPMAGPRVGILASSGGAGIWAADACEDAGLAVPVATQGLRDRLRPLMPDFGSPRNPVDVTAQAIWEGGLTPPLRTMLDSGEFDGIVLATSLTSPHRLAREADELARLMSGRDVPVVVYSYTAPAPASAALLWELGLPWYPTPHRAARALRALAGPRSWEVTSPPPSLPLPATRTAG